MIRHFTFLSLLLTLILFSCQKEISIEKGTTPAPPVLNDSILISKVVGLDTTKTAPLDTVYKYLATYDNVKRVLTSLLIDYNNTGVIVDTFWSKKHYYNGTDTMPNKIISVVHDYSILFDTAYYSYSTPIRNIISDSSVVKDINPLFPDLEAQIYKYSYSSNWIYTTETRYTNNVMQSQDSYQVYITRQNSNIVSQIDTLQNDRESFTAFYDTKQNPLEIINFSVPYFAFGNEYLLYNGNNNVTEINNSRQNLFGNATEHYKYTYRYNSLGYPTDVNVQNIGSTYPRPINKIKYFYTN